MKSNLNTISVLEFWRKYSLGQIVIQDNKDLPLRLNHGMAFDGLFGSLALHKIVSERSDEIQLECAKCKNMVEGRSDICESHLGIIQGQFERLNNRTYSCHKKFERDICHIVLR